MTSSGLVGSRVLLATQNEKKQNENKK